MKSIISDTEFEFFIKKAHFEWAQSMAKFKQGPSPTDAELSNLGRVPFFEAARAVRKLLNHVWTAKLNLAIKALRDIDKEAQNGDGTITECEMAAIAQNALEELILTEHTQQAGGEK